MLATFTGVAVLPLPLHLQASSAASWLPSSCREITSAHFDTLGNDMTKEENNQYFKVARRRRINN
jgi:hypothetical protein